MLARIAHDLRRRVKAHRLAVQERGREHIRVVAFQPARDVDEVGKARRVALGKSVFAKTLDLGKAARRKGHVITPHDHPVDELLVEELDRADALEGRHGAAQLVGLRGFELRRHDRNAHRLLLKQRHAHGLVQNLLQLVGRPMVRGGGRIGRLDAGLAEFLARQEIGVHHASLNRAWAHDRDLDDEIIEFFRAQPRQHRHLRAAFDLEGAERVGALDHPVDRL
jgi:hypothetical protein